MTHPLDRPVWSALTSGWGRFAQGDPAARQLKPEYGPFAATRETSPEGLNALTRLSPGPDGLWLVERARIDAPPGLRVESGAELCQMIAPTLTPGRVRAEAVDLSEADYPDMLALALMTQPGPFAARTGELGRFIGIRVQGRLVAMAGERMRTDGFTEVSGVCTHPDHRGQGYAAGLMRQVMASMMTRQETPFLHSYSWNHAAIALYESLGFQQRQTLYATVLRPVVG